MSEKRTYRISATLLNAWQYYLANPSPSQLRQFKDNLENKFKPNKWLMRGIKFEKEVNEGKHGTLSQLVMPLEKQTKLRRTIELPEFNIEVVGKPDAIDRDKHRLYDIKRVDEFTDNKYDSNLQHWLYFFLMEDIKEFYYLVVEGPNSNIIQQHVVKYERPDNELLETMITKYVQGFLAFLEEQKLLDVYMQNHINKERKKVTLEDIEGDNY